MAQWLCINHELGGHGLIPVRAHAQVEGSISSGGHGGGMQ